MERTRLETCFSAHPYNNGYIYTHTPHALFEDKQTCQGNKNLLPNMEGSWTIGFDQFGYLAQRAKELLGLLLPQGQCGWITSPPFHQAVTCGAQLCVPELIHVFVALCNPSHSVGFGSSQSWELWGSRWLTHAMASLGQPSALLLPAFRSCLC